MDRLYYVASGLACIITSSMRISCTGRCFLPSTGTRSRASSTSMPSITYSTVHHKKAVITAVLVVATIYSSMLYLFTWPNIVYLLFRCGWGA